MLLKMKATAALFLCLLGASHVGAADYVYPRFEPFPVEVIAASDGDTFSFRALNCRPAPLCFRKARVLGTDTPEKHLPKKGSKSKSSKGLARCVKEARLGVTATAWAHEKLDGKIVTITPAQHQEQQDPYGRLLVEVTLPDGRSYKAEIIAAGLAAPYDPQKAKGDKKYLKPSWCD
jgi:endonuclease YncB( thermonuclease family)